MNDPAASSKSRDPNLAPPPDVASTLGSLAVVSEDGKFIATAMRVADGARGNDNLAVGLFEVDADRMVEKVVIIDPAEPAKVDRLDREARARALLAQHRWRPLEPYDMRADSEGPVRQSGVGAPFRGLLADGEGIRVIYREPTFVVSDSGAGRALLRKQVPRFSVPAGTRCKGCPNCPAPLAALGAVYGDRARGVLLLVIRYQGGTDVCWEPDESFHAVRIPGHLAGVRVPTLQIAPEQK